MYHLCILKMIEFIINNLTLIFDFTLDRLINFLAIIVQSKNLTVRVINIASKSYDPIKN